YLAIAEAVGRAIADGTLSPGVRLPPQRELAFRLGVTVGTVGRAYATAAQRGLVGGEVGRGTFVVGPGEAPAPGLPREPRRAGTVDMTVNLPADVGQGAVLADALRRLPEVQDREVWVAYPTPAGAPEHKAAGSAWLSRLAPNVVMEDVFVCAGAQQAIAAAMAVEARAGDVVVAESLSYPGFAQCAATLDLRIAAAPMDEEGVVPDAFEALVKRLRPRLLCLVPTFHNPTNIVMPAERRRQVAEVCRRHGVAIIEDDVYTHLLAEPPAPLSAIYPEGTYLLTSLSKAISPALRVGYLLCPAGRGARVEAVLAGLSGAINPISVALATRLLSDGAVDRLLDAQRREIAARQATAQAALASFNARLHPASLHAWLELPPPWRANDFVEAAASRNLRIAPTECFAVGRAEAPHCVRLALGAVRSRDELTQALETVTRILEEPPLVRAAAV
ncbi:MAG: PLP-dependent aminotransferase family protein, partial [Alphaproteobacteria bacterium]